MFYYLMILGTHPHLIWSDKEISCKGQAFCGKINRTDGIILSRLIKVYNEDRMSAFDEVNAFASIPYFINIRYVNQDHTDINVNDLKRDISEGKIKLVDNFIYK